MIYLNGDAVNVTLFPDNTSQVWKLDERQLNWERAVIRWEFLHEGEIMQIAQLKTLLDTRIDYITLRIEYLPYGRQDKPISNNATFGLWTFAKILNSLNFEEVIIMDPHSKIALGAIERSRAIYPHSRLESAIQTTDSNLLCYPDHGALDKYVGTYLTPLPYIYGEKIRDQATGHITDYKLMGDCYGKRVLIVDDICDGGKTFELLADELYGVGAKDVNLFVTHGIFSKGLMPLFKVGIRHIFTNNGEAIIMFDGEVGYKDKRNL